MVEMLLRISTRLDVIALLDNTRSSESVSCERLGMLELSTYRLQMNR